MGEKGIEIMTSLLNKIYKSWYIPEDFRKSIFIPIQKVSKAQECSDFRSIALVSYASKVFVISDKMKNHANNLNAIRRKSDGFQKRKMHKRCCFSAKNDQ